MRKRFTWKCDVCHYRTLSSVYLSLFLDISAPPPDPRCPLVKEMLPHIYTTYVSGILGLVGDRVVDPKKDNLQLKTLTSGGKYSVSKYTEASTVQIYKIVSCRPGMESITLESN